MKKILIIFFSVIFLSAVSFGAGIGIAELVLINQAKNKTTLSSVPQETQKKQQEQKEEQKEATEKTETAIETPTAVVSEENKPIEEAAPASAPAVEPITFSFAILGDTQSAKPDVFGGFQKAVRKISGLNPAFIISTGDQASDCDSENKCRDELSAWKAALGKYSSKIYPVQGNHDRTGREKSDSAWEEVFSLPTNGPEGFSEFAYSFNFKNSHFVVLDSEKPNEHTINEKQRSWLEQDLAKNKLATTFVFFHEPAYPVSSKIGESLDVKSGERDALWDIITRHKVTAVFVGHEHIHSRKKINGIYQIGFGNTESFNHEMPKAGMAEYAYRGQNFGLVEVKDKEITVKVYTVDGKLINTKVFTR